MELDSDLEISSMEEMDVMSCAELVYDGFGSLFDRFLLPNLQLAPQQWKERQMEYRIKSMTLLQKATKKEQEDTHCKVLRIKATGEVVGMVAWEDKGQSHPFQSAAIEKDQSGPSGKEEIPPAILPSEIDSDAWDKFRFGPYQYKPEKDEVPSELFMLVVKSSQRNRRLGAVLLGEFLQSIQGRGAFLSSAMRAVPLYERHGFVIVPKSIKDGGIPVPTRVGEEKGVENSWPMIRPAVVI